MRDKIIVLAIFCLLSSSVAFALNIQNEKINRQLWHPSDVSRLETFNGNPGEFTLVLYSDGINPADCGIYVYDQDGKILWGALKGEMNFPHTAAVTDSSVIVSDTRNGRIIEVLFSTKRIIWDSSQFGLQLGWPNEAEPTPWGTFLISSGNFNYEVNRKGEIIHTLSWSQNNYMSHDIDVLPDGHELHCFVWAYGGNGSDSENRFDGQVVELNAYDKICWRYSPPKTMYQFLRDAIRRENNNTVISLGESVIEVNYQREIVWSFSPGCDIGAYNIKEINNGYLITTHAGVIEVDFDGNILKMLQLFNGDTPITKYNVSYEGLCQEISKGRDGIKRQMPAVPLQIELALRNMGYIR